MPHVYSEVEGEFADGITFHAYFVLAALMQYRKVRAMKCYYRKPAHSYYLDQKLESAVISNTNT